MGCLGFFCVILNSRCKINRIANTGIGGAVLCAGITGDHFAGCDPNADLDFDFVLRSLFNVKAFEQFDHFQRGAHGMFTMSLVINRRAEDRHQAITLPVD